MKTLKLVCVLIMFSAKLFGQGPLWTEKTMNSILTVKLPAKNDFSSYSYLKQYCGYVNMNFFCFRYYDTTMNVKDAKEFQISLTGYVHGLLMDSTVNHYKTTIGD